MKKKVIKTVKSETIVELDELDIIEILAKHVKGPNHVRADVDFRISQNALMGATITFVDVERSEG